MKIFNYIRLLILILFIVLFNSCDEEESGLLSNLFYGETGKGIIVSGYHVISDISQIPDTINSGNGIINRGEKAYVSIKLTNRSKKTAENISMRISTENKFISNISPLTAIAYGDMKSNEESISHDSYIIQNGIPTYYTFTFNVATNLPENDDVIFLLEISSEKNLENVIQFTPLIY